jgi:hypothetical protein
VPDALALPVWRTPWRRPGQFLDLAEVVTEAAVAIAATLSLVGSAPRVSTGTAPAGTAT